MDDLLVSITTHDELRRRGADVLKRSLDSLSRAMAHLARSTPGVDVYVGCCDDASADSTAEYVEGYFAGKAWFRLARNEVSRYAGFTRNVAAGLFPTALICFLDADDEYKEDHLEACLAAMTDYVDGAGRKYAMASTGVELSAAVHPDWQSSIAQVLPLNKVIRREAWDFVEGMPTEEIYRQVTCEDQFLVQKVATFFHVIQLENVTTRYWSYPGSAFDSQLGKFQRPRAEFNPAADVPPGQEPLHARRLQSESAFIRYLRGKWHSGGWKDKFAGYATKIA